jgi:V/A-type H+-transporting ATPase subunit D
MSSQKVLPTKINLIQLRNQLKLVRVIKRLLESKREVLLIYLRSYSTEYEKLYEEVNSTLKEVYGSFLQAIVDEGVTHVQDIANSQSEKLSVKSSTKVIFGVKIPVTELDKSTIPEKPFNEIEVSPYLSKSYDEMRDALIKVIKLVELESTIRSLTSELMKTQRLINAIDSSILPFYTSSIKYIRGILSDRSRDDFVRLKITRRILQRKRENAS